MNYLYALQNIINQTYTFTVAGYLDGKVGRKNYKLQLTPTCQNLNQIVVDIDCLGFPVNLDATRFENGREVKLKCTGMRDGKNTWKYVKD